MAHWTVERNLRAGARPFDGIVAGRLRNAQVASIQRRYTPRAEEIYESVHHTGRTVQHILLRHEDVFPHDIVTGRAPNAHGVPVALDDDTRSFGRNHKSQAAGT